MCLPEPANLHSWLILVHSQSEPVPPKGALAAAQALTQASSYAKVSTKPGKRHAPPKAQQSVVAGAQPAVTAKAAKAKAKAKAKANDKLPDTAVERAELVMDQCANDIGMCNRIAMKIRNDDMMATQVAMLDSSQEIFKTQCAKFYS